MTPKLMAVWLLFPCDSPIAHDYAMRTTTVIACPNTFGEAAGPFLAKGPPPPVAPPVTAAPEPQAGAPFRRPILENSNKLSLQYEERKLAEKATPPKKKKKRKKKRRR